MMNPSKSPDKKANNWVSVIVPTYNRAKYITKALDSVREQTYRPIELLVVDDGSKDNTRVVVKEWTKEHREEGSFVTRYIHKENGGAPSARNNGIRNSKGRYLQFLDSDDILVNEKLSLQIDLMKAEKTSLCICDYVHIDHKDNVIYKANRDYSINFIIENFKAVLTSCPIIDRTRFPDDILKWNEKISRLQDKDFFLKILMTVDRISYCDKYLFKWVWHPDDRIEDIGKGRKVHWDILKSLIVFNFKHFRSISSDKFRPIIGLYIKLAKKTLGIGRFIPNRLKFWR